MPPGAVRPAGALRPAVRMAGPAFGGIVVISVSGLSCSPFQASELVFGGDHERRLRAAHEAVAATSLDLARH